MDVMNCGGEQPSITLRYAKTIKDTSSDKNAMAERPIDEKVFALRDVVQILAREVRMAAEDVGPADSFETDAAIGRGRGG